MSADNGHTSLDSKILNDASASNLRLVLVKRTIDVGSEDLVVHGYANIFGPTVTSNTVLQGNGFQTYKHECPYVGHQGCYYRIFPRDTSIDLELMAKEITGVVPKIKDAEQALERCGLSIFHDRIRTTKEGHQGVQKKVTKKLEDSTFTYIMTYIQDEYGNGTFVTHFVPKQGPTYSSELMAFMDFLEINQFHKCPESEYGKCFYTTYENENKGHRFGSSTDIAYKYFDNLEHEFMKAYELLMDADICLRKVGLNVLEYKEVASSSIETGSTIELVDKKTVDVSPEVISGWDAFICHASEDKDPFVRELARELTEKGLNIWYDEFTLRVGDRLRRSIDGGLAKSKYGIVVLSPYFFKKEWPQKELDGLAVRERNGVKVILPVWLEVDEGYIAQYSPTLADRVAAKATEGIEMVIKQLIQAME